MPYHTYGTEISIAMNSMKMNLKNQFVILKKGIGIESHNLCMQTI